VFRAIPGDENANLFSRYPAGFGLYLPLFVGFDACVRYSLVPLFIPPDGEPKKFGIPFSKVDDLRFLRRNLRIIRLILSCRVGSRGRIPIDQQSNPLIEVVEHDIRKDWRLQPTLRHALSVDFSF
jgi:hypothetical protein